MARPIVALAQVDTRSSAVNPWALARVMLTYMWRHQRVPDLGTAPRFTEMVQRCKLHDRDPGRRQDNPLIPLNLISAQTLKYPLPAADARLTKAAPGDLAEL